VNSVSHWTATNNVRDNLKKREYLRRYGHRRCLAFAREHPFQRERGRLQPTRQEPDHELCMR